MQSIYLIVYMIYHDSCMFSVWIVFCEINKIELEYPNAEQ